MSEINKLRSDVVVSWDEFFSIYKGELFSQTFFLLLLSLSGLFGVYFIIVAITVVDPLGFSNHVEYGARFVFTILMMWVMISSTGKYMSAMSYRMRNKYNKEANDLSFIYFVLFALVYFGISIYSIFSF